MDDFTQQEREVYAKLADEQSKRVFCVRRCTKELCPEDISDYMNEEPVAEYMAINECRLNGQQKDLDAFMESFLERDCKFIIYAYSRLAIRIAKIIEQKRNDACMGIWDINPAFDGAVCHGITVHTTPITYDEAYKDIIVLLTVPIPLLVSEIKSQLLALGFQEENINCIGEYDDVYATNYAAVDIIKHHYKSREVFVDGGVLNLTNTIEFLQEIPGDGYVYAFEPDKCSYSRCMKKLSDMGIDNVRLENAALWSHDGMISFSDNDKHGSSKVKEGGNTQIKSVALDTYLNGEEVSFVKLDVEGSELEALKGMANTIRKWKPKLAICIYHKPNDYVDIPAYILSLVPDYKLYMRHYADIAVETILFAVH